MTLAASLKCREEVSFLFFKYLFNVYVIILLRRDDKERICAVSVPCMKLY